MTIITAAIRDGHGAMTTDSFGSSNGVGRTCGHKFLNVEQPDLIFGYAGCYRVAQIAEDVILDRDPFKNGVDYWKTKTLANSILRKCLDWTDGEFDLNSVPDFGADLMIVSSDNIYVIQSDFAVFEFDDFASIGLADEGTMILNMLYQDKRKTLKTITETAVNEICKVYRGQCALPLHTREI